MGKRGSISESDMTVVCERYGVGTVLALLREVARCDTAALNWEALVSKTATGIKNPREYQALWRHLAYRNDLADNFEEDAQPLDDESDLDFDVEPSPPVTPEVAAEVATRVKADLQRVGIGSIMNGKRKAELSLKAKHADVNSLHGLMTSSSYVKQGASPGGNASERKKRKLWTAEEDEELIAAVEKCGEGNWTNILKNSFRHDRTASQLSQRWAIIRKRRDATPIKIEVSNNDLEPGTTSSSLIGTVEKTDTGKDEVQLANAATRGAGTTEKMPSVAAAAAASAQLGGSSGNSMAVANGSSSRSVSGKYSTPTGPAPSTGRLVAPGAVVMSAAAAQAASVGGAEMWQVSARNGSGGSKRLKPGGAVGPDPMVQAAAVAAGARIAPASTAGSFLRAATPAIQGSSNPRPASSVHYIRTGSGATAPTLPQFRFNNDQKPQNQTKGSSSAKAGGLVAAMSSSDGSCSAGKSGALKASGGNGSGSSGGSVCSAGSSVGNTPPPSNSAPPLSQLDNGTISGKGKSAETFSMTKQSSSVHSCVGSTAATVNASVGSSPAAPLSQEDTLLSTTTTSTVIKAEASEAADT